MVSNLAVSKLYVQWLYDPDSIPEDVLKRAEIKAKQRNWHIYRALNDEAINIVMDDQAQT